MKSKIFQIGLLAVAIITLVIYLYGAPQVDKNWLVLVSGACAFGFITLRTLK